MTSDVELTTIELGISEMTCASCANRISRSSTGAHRPAEDLSITGNGGSLDDPSGIRYLYGRTSSKVASVEIITTDHLEVTSSVSDGAFMAWWPGSEAPDQVIARDAVGQVIATMHPETK